MFKVGQTVWCLIYGQGVVTDVDSERTEETYSVFVKFQNYDELHISYTMEGKFHNQGNITLFPYPVEVVSRVVRPTIDWSHVHTKYRWLAKDPSGSHWLHEKQPYKTDCGWKSENGDCTCADGFATLSPGFCDWEDSLIVGPGGL